MPVLEHQASVVVLVPSRGVAGLDCRLDSLCVVVSLFARLATVLAAGPLVRVVHSHHCKEPCLLAVLLGLVQGSSAHVTSTASWTQDLVALPAMSRLVGESGPKLHLPSLWAARTLLLDSDRDWTSLQQQQQQLHVVVLEGNG